MFRKSMALFLIIVMVLTVFPGIALAVASAAPDAPASVDGATYYLNKAFTARPTGNETVTEGATYTWGCSGSNTFSSEYNALKTTAYINAVYSEALSAEGDYVMSADFMAPSTEFGSAIRMLMDSSFWVATLDAEGNVYLCNTATGKKLATDTWYRLNIKVSLPSGDVTSTITDIATGEVFAAKSATGKVKSITQFRIAPGAVLTNPLYIQNWVMYKEKAKAKAPAAPEDDANATYYMKGDFASSPSGTVTPVEGVSYTWATARNNTFDSGYNALAMYAVQKAVYATPLSDDGKYVVSIDFMTPDTNIFGGSTLSGARIVLRLGSYDLGRIVDGKLNYLCGQSVAQTLEADNWYRLSAEITLPSGDITAKVTNLSANTDGVTKSAVAAIASIGGIEFNYGIVATNPIYTQSWRIYKLQEVVEEIEDKTYTTDDFDGISKIVSRTVYDGSLPIRPMTIDDACLTETISGGNGGKEKSDRIYTFNYDTTPKVEQVVGVFQSGSFTDNYTEFDFKLNDDNAQIVLFYNYFTSAEHSNSAHSTIFQLLNISSDGIKVGGDATTLENPNVMLTGSINTMQWHRIGVFFSSTADEIVVYYDGTKYTIPINKDNNILQYGARAVRWRIVSKRESMQLSIDNLYMDNLYEGTVDYSARLVNRPALVSFKGTEVDSENLVGAMGMSVAEFKEAITCIDTTAIRIFKDISYAEEVTDNDSYIIDNATKLVLSNQEKLYSYYNLGDSSSVAITSETLTIDGSYIHGYAKNETVQSLISKLTLPQMATAKVYNKSEELTLTEKIKPDMILTVTSADGYNSANYIICNGELFVGSVEYVFGGVNVDGTFSNASIDISIPVINYTNDAKYLTIIIARYEGETLDQASIYEKTADAYFDGAITQNYVDEQNRAANVYYKIFVWEKNSLAPLQKSQVFSSGASGKKIVIFGDSISAPIDGYATMLAQTTGATVTNGAIGGARISDRDDNDSFGKYKLDLQNIVDGLITPDYDWSVQESYTVTANTKNFANMDLSATDAAIIWIGTNDYGASVTLENFEAAAKDVLDKLTTNYPDLKIILASPIYRARMAGGDGRNSFEYTNANGDYLYEYGEVYERLSKNYANVIFLDLYNESGITKFTNEKYDYLKDGLHPYTGSTSKAYKIVNAKFAQLISSVLK